jgi:flagellar protein FlaG
MNIQSMSGTAPGLAPGGKEVRFTPPAVQPSQSAPAKAQEPVSTEASRKAEKPSEKAVQDAVDRVAQFVSQSNNEISFSVDSKSGSSIVKVIDSASKEVIRQMPSEEVVAISQALDKLQGLFVRDKA